ncbi:Proline iminopeptidase [Mycoplasmopsis canis UFG4]|uniref:Proline iminopeptidase n=1 Tax=Mycoplasmopsis canis UFG4 TaxID=1131455 RepID=I1A773_9BACT|nr:Proline iminopeptidase [Mycoplasmopsis canis UFG4]
MYFQDQMKQMKNHSNFENYISQEFIKVSKLHSVYYEIHGNPNGDPVFIIHGGPGGGSSYVLKKLFNLDIFKLIFIDQRGCGKSQPFLQLKENTTQDLVEDIEKIRKHLNIDKITLFGGSWGTTLSLAYSIKYPKNIKRILLRAVFLGRQEDIDFLYEENGASDYYPDVFDEYKNFVKNLPGRNILHKYYNIFKGERNNFQEEAAKIFSNWESSLVSIKKFKPKKRLSKEEINSNLAISLFETHYFVNNCFFQSDNYLLENAKVISNIPTFIVHGRQDIDCRPIGAYLLHKLLMNSKLFLVDGASHTSLEKNMWKTLKKIINEWENSNK